MGESALLEALITGFIGLIVTAATAGGVAAYTFRSLSKTTGDLADRLSKTIDERDEASKAKVTEMEARASITLDLANVRNELTVVSKNAAQMDEAVRQMGIRLTAVESEKKAVESERDQLKIENELLKAENSQLKLDNSSLGEQINGLQTQVNELKEKVTRLETQTHPETAIDPTPAESLDHVAQLTSAGVKIELDKAVKPEGSTPL